jgi:hypothetical protein
MYEGLWMKLHEKCEFGCNDLIPIEVFPTLFFFWVQTCAIGPTFLEFNWNRFGLIKLNISYQNMDQN